MQTGIPVTSSEKLKVSKSLETQEVLSMELPGKHAGRCVFSRAAPANAAAAQSESCSWYQQLAASARLECKGMSLPQSSDTCGKVPIAKDIPLQTLAFMFDNLLG